MFMHYKIQVSQTPYQEQPLSHGVCNFPHCFFMSPETQYCIIFNSQVSSIGLTVLKTDNLTLKQNAIDKHKQDSE